MRLLDNSDKHLMSVMPDVIFEKLNKRAADFKFIGGGSYGRVYKVTLSDGDVIAIKGYKLQEMQNEEALQLSFLSKNTSVISKYYDVLLMSFFEEIIILA